MTQEQAFLEKIIAEPGDDAYRFAFADWLEEQGRDYESRKLREPSVWGSWRFQSSLGILVWKSESGGPGVGFASARMPKCIAERDCNSEVLSFVDGAWWCLGCLKVR